MLVTGLFPLLSAKNAIGKVFVSRGMILACGARGLTFKFGAVLNFRKIPFGLLTRSYHDKKRIVISGGLSNLGAPITRHRTNYFFASRCRHHVHSTVVRPFCKIGKIGGKLWRLYALGAMAQ